MAAKLTGSKPVATGGTALPVVMARGGGAAALGELGGSLVCELPDGRE